MMEEKKWELTFSDMLTLLLTFFVFIISISTFKTKEYKQFWEQYKQQKETRSFSIDLIDGLKTPKLSRPAEKLLTELADTFNESDYQGVGVNYNENRISLMISEQLSFDGGKYELKPEAQILLSKLLPGFKNSKFDIEVEGHTDSLSNERINNMELSLQRALTVARFLEKNGLDKHKLSVSGYGPYRPVDTNKTLEGRTRNRRVEINIIINN
ncbi:MAG: flagellar motor protein MotB [bacterium]|nr:flagellar motor protein MotB [bacterium]